MDNHKRRHGQYYTTTNPFLLQPFIHWMKSIPNVSKERFLEPFAGSNNIPKMIHSAPIPQPFDWACFDLEPAEENQAPQWTILRRDTLSNYPKGYLVAITNPPYLARNSATRRGLSYSGGYYNDLYQYALALMLRYNGYVAAIIPESFLGSGLFRDRLNAVISLPTPMFLDTEAPVCLALFTPLKSPDVSVYILNDYINTLSGLNRLRQQLEPKNKEGLKQFQFNCPRGDIGAVLIDDTKAPSIRFMDGYDIDARRISNSSRTITRIALHDTSIDPDDVIQRANKILNDYREDTKDLLLTPFKGLREDNCYRRRLDYKTARLILSKALEQVQSKEKRDRN